MNNHETINRELTWLDFNERVLQEGLDKNNPLLERVKFLGIFSNNRDEFFRVRFASLRRVINHPETSDDKRAELKKIQARILDIVAGQEKIYTEGFKELIIDLKKHNINFINEGELNAKQGKLVREYFINEVRPAIFPIMLDNFNRGETLRDNAIYLAVVLSSNKEDVKEKHALIQIPTDLNRFFILKSDDDKHLIMFIEDVIRYNLDYIFTTFGFTKFKGYIIKFTRDSELDIDNDISKSFMEVMTESLSKRKKGLPVRFVYDKEIPEKLLLKVFKKLKIEGSYDSLRGGGRYHNFKDLMNFPMLDKSLTFAEQKPLRHCKIPENKSIFKILKKQDILLNYPYHSYQHLVDILRESSIDPKVRAIKMTFYRTAKNSKAMNALINAARNGKQVTVFMELQARFDEEANIYWSRKLQSEGVKVLQTIPGVKVHAKLISIRRKENDDNIYYSLISTGNFHEATAKIYSDLSLVTANQVIGQDVTNFFHLLESRYLPPVFKELTIAPFDIRKFFMRKINREIRNSKLGKEARVIMKANSLVDDEIAHKIYTANRSGVKFDLIIRGMNVLMTNKPGETENIKAISIVGRYLEHARIFVFHNDGDPEIFISSADLMTRNIDHRFEVICPIYDPILKNEIMQLLDIQLRDNVKARSLDHGKVNNYILKKDEEPAINSHTEIYNYFSGKCETQY